MNMGWGYDLNIIIIFMFLSHFSGSGNVKTRAATRNFGSNGGEKSPMITTAHSTKGGQQQQRTDDVRAARKQVSI